MYLYTVFDKSVHSWQFSEGQRLILRPFLVKIWVWSFTLNWSDVANENHFTQGIFIKISITSSENFPDGTGYWKGDKPLTVRLLFKNRRQPFGRLFCWLSWALLCYIGPHFYFSFFDQNIFETWSLLRAGRSNIKKLLVGRCLLLRYTPRWSIRDGFKKSKWKFKMAFAMRGWGGREGVSSATYLFWKMIFLKTI